MNKLAKSLLIIDAILLGAAGIFGFLGYMTNGYESAAPMYIKSEAGVVATSLALPQGEALGVRVIGTGIKKAPDYQIEIIPNADNDSVY